MSPDGSYRPSGDVEAVLAEFFPSVPDLSLRLTLEPAGTLGSVAEHRKRVAAAQRREVAAAEDDDPAAMEHEAARQAWLARVQRVNWR